ncbi:MAG: 3-dehydroquinate dehydratase, partial [bacterium]
MIDELFFLSRHFLNACNRDYKRYFLKKYTLENRFNIITGQRGVGKTTAIIQHLLSKYDSHTRKALYLPVDHFVFGKRSLYETAEEFHN